MYNSSSPWCIDDTTKQQCYTQRGGLYDPTQSSSANFGLDVYAAGGEVHDTDRAAATHIWFNSFFEDTLRLGNASIDDFPLGMPGFDVGGRFDTQANLGLGQNSTLLSHLKESGRIASRTYSYWAGVGTATEGVTRDGALVLGGYDAAKVIGPNITGNLQPWSLGCPSGMYVTVNGMELNFPNGTNADMITPSVLTACLQVDFPYLITLPQIPYFRHFEAFTQTQAVANSEGIYWWAKGYYPGTA